MSEDGLLEAGIALALRELKILQALEDNPTGLTKEELLGYYRFIGNYSAVVTTLNQLYVKGEIVRFHGEHGRLELVKTSDPWYQEPKQRFMRRVVLAVLQNHIAGYSRGKLADILRRRDKACNDAFTWRLVDRMLGEGVIITANGTEIVMERLLDTNGGPHKPLGAATLDSTPVERPATVLRLSASRWLKDTANDE